MPLDYKLDHEFDQQQSFPLSRRLADMAAQEEIAALVQFAFFRPHLAGLLRACVETQVDLLMLKGAALAETVYPRPSLRRFGDLDVLVREADAARARTLLESLGYIADPMQWEELVRGRDCQANFFYHTDRGSVVVELHTKLINNDLFFGQVHVDDQGLWERAQPVRLAGADGWVLGLEDQILHLCLHLAGHYLAAPQSLRDIAQICSVSRVDWPLFIRLAQQAGAATACFAGLFAAARLLGTPVPPAVLDALAPRARRRRLEQIAEERAADSIGDITAVQTEHLRFPLLWHLLGSSQARGRAVWHIIFPSRHWLITHYYFDRFDQSDQSEVSNRARWDPSHSRLTTRNAPHYALTFLSLYGVHWASLLRRSMSALRR